MTVEHDRATEAGVELKGEDYRRYLVCLWQEDKGDDWIGRWFHQRDAAVLHLLEERSRRSKEGHQVFVSGAVYDLDQCVAMLTFPEDWDGHSGPRVRSKRARA